jgi:hypothetical protein
MKNDNENQRFPIAASPFIRFDSLGGAGAVTSCNKGKQLRDILGKKGYPLGQEIMQKATEGTTKEVTYWWPRTHTDKPLEKTAFYTKVGDQICSVGYYKE